MKYVANMFSLKMTDDCIMTKKEINEETFNILLKELRPVSYMSKKDLAAIYGVEYNPKNFQLKAGDILLVAMEVKDETNFYCIKVVEEL